MTRTSTNTLGFAKPPQDTRVVVAMSGGVDSSVVAADLAAQGYKVIGITLQLYDHGAALAKAGACCAGRDIHDARRIAEQLDFPHYVLDYESKFREEVMEDFAETYLAGATPVPCIRCNEGVKFRDLLATARDLEADCLATGHYIQRKTNQTHATLHMAADITRDQSYFLFSTKQEQLDYLRFPLGGLKSKTATRALARKYGLSVADKPDSQDICFVPNGSYTSVIEKLRPGVNIAGDIVDLDGQVLSRHQGIIHYTIGQRRGLGIGGGDPLYVVRLDAERHQVVVGPRGALERAEFEVKQVNWLGDGAFAGEGYDLAVRVRSTRPPCPARVVPLGDGRARVILAEPEEGIARGQACVFYQPNGTRVFGGGWIC